MKKDLVGWVLPGAICAGLALLLTGCFDTKQEFTLNPDGSGKVVHECLFQNVDLSEPKDTSESALKESIRKFIEESKGVEAWRDVTYKRMDDGRLFFRGTAYFKNLSQLDIRNQATMEFVWRKLGDGNIVLDVRTNKSEPKQGFSIRPSPPRKAPATPEEEVERFKEERAKFQQVKPMLAAIFGSMKQEVTLHLPGQIKEASNYQKDPSGALKIKFDGAKILEAMEKLVVSDEWMKKRLASGDTDPTGMPGLDDELNGSLFGKAGPVRAVMAGASKPLFDYGAELAVAQKEFAKVQKDLGASVVSVAPAAQGEPLKSIRVVGVRLVTELDKALKLRPFNYDTGYTMAMLAELPGSVLAVTGETSLDTAVADDGTSLLPDSKWNRQIHFPNLSADKSKVLFEVQLKVPGPNVKGLKELSGQLQYSVSSSSKETDLGLQSLKEGAQGTEMGAKIQSIGEGWNKDGSQQMQLKLNIREESLKNAWVLVDGARTPLERRGYSGGGNSYTFTLESKRAFPVAGRIVVETFDKLQVFNVPWKLEDLNLLGVSATAKN